MSYLKPSMPVNRPERSALLVKPNAVKENAIQLSLLVLALTSGALTHGWAGAGVGFLVFAAVIVLRVRFKMGKAQEIGRARAASRQAARVAAAADVAP